MLVGILPLSVLSISAENVGENAVSAPGAAWVSAMVYPELTSLIKGTEIEDGYRYSFYKSGRVERNSTTLDPETYIYTNNLLKPPQHPI